MLSLTIKEAELVRGLCAKGRVSVSDSDLVKIASLLPRQMLKEAAKGNASQKMVQKMNGALSSISNLVSKKKQSLNSDALKKLMNDNLQAAANEPLGFFGKLKRWFSGGGLTKAQQETARKATNAGMTYGDYLAKLKKFKSLESAMNTGGISQQNYNDYGQLARELGIFTGGGGSTPISQDTFDVLQDAVNHISSSASGAQKLRTERDSIAKINKQLTRENKTLNNRINKINTDNVKATADLNKKHQDEITNMTNTFNATKAQEATQRQIQDMQNQLDAYKNKRWYQDPGTAAAAGIGGSLAGIAGLNAMSNMFGQRDSGDRRGRGPVIIP